MPNRVFFYSAGFVCDCYNYVAILAEAFFAAYVLQATEFEMGLLGSCGALGYALPCVWTGLVSERFGRRRMVLIAAAGHVAAYLVTPHVPSIAALCAVSFFRSLATSFYWPPLMAWMAETARRGSLSAVLGGYNTSWAAGILVGYGICGWLFQHIGPAAPFHFAAVLAALTFVAFVVLTPGRLDIEAHEHDLDAHDARAFVREGLLLNSLGYFTAALVLYMFPKIVGTALGESDQSVLHVIRMAAQVLTFFVLTHTVVWHFRRWPPWFCVGSYAGGMLAIGLATAYWAYAVGFALLGLGAGMGYMLSAYYVFALVRTKGLGGGVQESLIGAGNLFGPLYGGTVATQTSARGGVLAGVLPILAVWVYVRWPRNRNRNAQGATPSPEKTADGGSP